jgi:hypothetical protein
MRVADGVEKTIVFIGRSVPSGQFIPYGTGFLAAIIQDNVVFQNIVTARHVIDQIQGTDEILIRANTRSGSAKIITTERRWWFSPIEDVDLAFCPGRFSPEIYDILHVSLDNILDDNTIAKQNISIGEDVFICGMYLSRIGETRNLPIVRAGVISAMPSEMVRTVYGYHHVYLVEARSTGGLSGSPVFLQMAPFRFVNENLRPSLGAYPQYFMGMVLGHNKLSYPPELIKFLPPDLRSPEEKAEDEQERSIPLNTGIAVVLPVMYIVKAITDPKIMEERKAATERARKRSGYIPDSAIHIAGEDDPQC